MVKYGWNHCLSMQNQKNDLRILQATAKLLNLMYLYQSFPQIACICQFLACPKSEYCESKVWGKRRQNGIVASCNGKHLFLFQLSLRLWAAAETWSHWSVLTFPMLGLYNPIEITLLAFHLISWEERCIRNSNGSASLMEFKTANYSMHAFQR